MIRHFYNRDRRPAALLYAYLAAIFASLGHASSMPKTPARRRRPVRLQSLAVDAAPGARGDRRLLAKQARRPGCWSWARWPRCCREAFADLGVTVVKGEAEQLLWKLDEVLSGPGPAVQLGTIEDLDRLPLPDWSLSSRSDSASATISGDFPRRWCRPAAAAR